MLLRFELMVYEIDLWLVYEIDLCLVYEIDLFQLINITEERNNLCNKTTLINFMTLHPICRSHFFLHINNNSSHCGCVKEFVDKKVGDLSADDTFVPDI